MFRITIENLDTGEKAMADIHELSELAQVLFDDHSVTEDEELSEMQKAIKNMPEDVRNSPYLPIVLSEFEGRMLSPHTIQAMIDGVRYKERMDRSRGNR